MFIYYNSIFNDNHGFKLFQLALRKAEVFHCCFFVNMTHIISCRPYFSYFCPLTDQVNILTPYLRSFRHYAYE